jgi:hypothetical protein
LGTGFLVATGWCVRPSLKYLVHCREGNAFG